MKFNSRFVNYNIIVIFFFKFFSVLRIMLFNVDFNVGLVFGACDQELKTLNAYLVLN